MERINGFIMGQDSVHGVSTWKVRVNHAGHPLNSKKCRVMNTHEGYEPKQSDDVTFVIGSKIESGNIINLAYDVAPAIRESKVRSKTSTDTMNWFIVKAGDKIYPCYFGFKTIEEAREELGKAGEEVLAFIPFDIQEHLESWDDPDVEGGFRMVEALASTTATLQALEKLMTAVVNAALKASK